MEEEFKCLLDIAVNIKNNGNNDSKINATSLHSLLSQIIEKLAATQATQQMAAKVPVSVMDWLSKDRKKAPEGETSKKPSWMLLAKAASQEPATPAEPTEAKTTSQETTEAKKSPWSRLAKAANSSPSPSIVSVPSIDNSSFDKSGDENSKETGITQHREIDKPEQRLKELIDRLEKVESLLWRFEGRAEMNLPANEALVKGAESGESGEKPLTEMWQAIRLRNKVEANESGINKLVSIYEELNLNISKMEKELKEKNEHYAQKMEDMISKKEKSTDCDSALIPMLCVHG